MKTIKVHEETYGKLIKIKAQREFELEEIISFDRLLNDLIEKDGPGEI